MQSLVMQSKSAPESGKVWGLHDYENFLYDDALSVDWRNGSIKVCFHPHMLDTDMSLQDNSAVSVFGLRSWGFKYIATSLPNKKVITTAQLQDKICLRVTSILVSKTGPWVGPGEASHTIYMIQLLAWFLVQLWAVPVQGVPDSASLQYRAWHVPHALPTTLFLHKEK